MSNLWYADNLLFFFRSIDATVDDSSFLPQDKVSEFAAMSPQQLLRETQRAAGDERLTAWHDTLINTGRDLRAVQEVSFFLHVIYAWWLKSH